MAQQNVNNQQPNRLFIIIALGLVGLIVLGLVAAVAIWLFTPDQPSSQQARQPTVRATAANPTSTLDLNATVSAQVQQTMAPVIGTTVAMQTQVAVALATPIPPTATATSTPRPSPIYTATIAMLQTQVADPPTNTPTATLSPTVAAARPTRQAATAVPTKAMQSSGQMPAFVSETNHGGWKIQGTDRLKDNPIIAGWIGRLKDPAPALWQVFPNVPNELVPGFKVVDCPDNPGKKCVPDGLEYGTYSSPYCFAHPCDIPVQPWEYRYITGDYTFLGQSCKGENGKGCMLVLVNEGDQAFTWRSQDVDNGFTLRGRYFNGDALEWGIWGLLSHGSANMLNMPTVSHPGEPLNAGAPGNSGGNCGTPLGCRSVDVTIVVHTGDAIVVVAKTTVTK